MVRWEVVFGRHRKDGGSGNGCDSMGFDGAIRVSSQSENGSFSGLGVKDSFREI